MNVATQIVTLLIQICTLLTAIVGLAMVLRRQRNTDDNVKRLEVNTNSISERNEAIAKKLGVAEGKQQERDNPGE